MVEGKNVTLECHVHANPSAKQVSWLRNGQPVSAREASTSNASLTLSNVGRHLTGKYACLSANVEGEGISNEIPIKVLCKHQHQQLQSLS